MFIEKQKKDSDIKYYLAYSFRKNGKIKKIRKYLGLNLTKDALENARKKAENLIFTKLYTDLFSFSLTNTEIEKLNEFNEKIKIFHLDQRQLARFTEKFVYHTNAIEGSTVLEREINDILKKKRLIEPDEIETLDVSKAFSYIRECKEDLSLNLIKKLHKICFEKTKVFAGKLRDVDVVIRDYNGIIIHQGAPVGDVENALIELVNWYNKNKIKFKPLVLATIVHNQFEHIHPFQDGNGRIGRLLLNFILIKNKYPPITIHLEDRSEYYQCLQKYDKIHDIKSMVLFLIKQYKKSLDEVTTKR